MLIDSLDGLHPHAARKALAAARNLRDGGSLTVIATATQPARRRDDRDRARPGARRPARQPILDLLASGTLEPELLVGEDGAKAIAQGAAPERGDRGGRR